MLAKDLSPLWSLSTWRGCATSQLMLYAGHIDLPRWHHADGTKCELQGGLITLHQFESAQLGSLLYSHRMRSFFYSNCPLSKTKQKNMHNTGLGGKAVTAVPILCVV